MVRKSWSMCLAIITAGLSTAAMAGGINESHFDTMAFCSDCTTDCGTAVDCGPACNVDCGQCGSGGCGGGGCGNGCGCCINPWQHSTGAFAEFLYLHPVGADLHHAQQQNGTGGAGTVPFGEIASADPQFSPGIRIGGSVACGPCSSIVGSYTFLETDSVSSVDVPGVNLQVGSLVHHPGMGITSSTGPLRATYDIDFQLADVMYRRLVVASQCGWMNYSAGLGYARIDQEFRQIGTFSGSQAGPLGTGTEIDFDGAGLRFGLDGERKLGRGRLSCYGKGNASALFGEFRGDYRTQNQNTQQDLAIARWTDDRVVSTLEYEIGLAWTSCSGRTRASVGYTGMHFFNMATTPTFIDAVQANNYSDFGDTLSLEGLVTRVEFKY